MGNVVFKNPLPKSMPLLRNPFPMSHRANYVPEVESGKWFVAPLCLYCAVDDLDARAYLTRRTSFIESAAQGNVM